MDGMKKKKPKEAKAFICGEQNGHTGHPVLQ